MKMMVGVKGIFHFCNEGCYRGGWVVVGDEEERGNVICALSLLKWTKDRHLSNKDTSVHKESI